MYIEHDYHYINSNEKLLIEKGYGKMSVHSIHFDRHYSEAQKAKNRDNAEHMTKEEWSRHCIDISKSLGKLMTEILNAFIKEYNIHQVSEETSTYEHYKSNWDLFFWSNKGWNGEDYFDYFKLNFNNNRTVEENMQLLKEIIPFVEAMNYENIKCHIQYCAVLDKDKIKTESRKICEKLANKFITYNGIEGKIKIVSEFNGTKQYGFFRKGARSKYYKISMVDLLAMEIK